MKLRKYFLLLLVFGGRLCFAVDYDCWKYRPHLTNQTENIIQDDQSGETYREFGKMTFGVDAGTDNGFIRINGVKIPIETIHYYRLDNGQAMQGIRADDLSMLMAWPVRGKHAGKQRYCLRLPFNGVGASGSFAKVQAVITIPLDAKKGRDLFGVVGKAWK